ncbi:MAG: prepilin-type N-terminal cleavage/methylation domain-containing protein [Phycisphaerales bacterium]|nr:prepilin-type N-terminal cleavage/methylation domain-containing protein [Phycisphaerales bacterium]
MTMRRGFTFIELLVAGVMASIVLGGVTTSLSQLGSAKLISRDRLDATSRADTALRTLRRDVISTLRRDDLFDTRLLIVDDTGRIGRTTVDRDELLLFNGTLRANKEIDFNGEGLEYETQFRIDGEELDAVLWKRRDPILDDNPAGGGMATPIAEGLVSLQLDAYDGEAWYAQWDSDIDGLPQAVRITVAAIGDVTDEHSDPSLVYLRTVVPIDRVAPPADLFEEPEEEEEEVEEGDGELDLGGATGGDGESEDGSGGAGEAGGDGAAGGSGSSSGGGSDSGGSGGSGDSGGSGGSGDSGGSGGAGGPGGIGGGKGDHDH